MRCTNPQTYGFKPDGKSITRSQRESSKEFAPTQLPCGKCISCQLNYAQSWAVRCVHEAQMYEENSFITLTYNDENLKSDKLIYSDFQKFMRRLRKTRNAPIGVFVTGEYGSTEKNRPHWHAILFNYRPKATWRNPKTGKIEPDTQPHYKNGRGDQVYTSESLSTLWGKGFAEFGSVNIHSAGYVARYAAKAYDQTDEHYREYKPVSKKSSKHAIGKKWLESFWPDVFNYGECRIDDKVVPIPRYYVKWLQKNQPERWKRYVTETKLEKIEFATDKQLQEISSELRTNDRRRAKDSYAYVPVTTRYESRKKILETKFKELQSKRKL